MNTLLTLAFLFASFFVLAQDSTKCACCDLVHDQFDFWVGDWIVYDTAGTEIGRNTIDELQDNCVIREEWRSANSTGTSYNYFNTNDSTWNQLWVDNSGTHLELKGSAFEKGMKLKSDWQTSSAGVRYYNEVIWEQQADGAVTQTWNIVSENKKILNTVFFGIYRKVD